MTKTDPLSLPQFAGKPVPWVTRWNEENLGLRYGVQMQRDGLRVTYGEGDYRDKHGVLWQKEGLTKSGVPQWARVSTYRQRSAMLRRKCQVCGHKIEERVIRWLMPPDGVEEMDGRSISMQPPTCEGCIDLSLELCPNLTKYGYMILKVLEYEIFGVYGEVLVPPGVVASLPPEEPRSPGPMGLWRIQTSVGYNEDYGDAGQMLKLTVAKQQIVELTKFVVEHVEQGRERPNNMGEPPSGVQAWLDSQGVTP